MAYLQANGMSGFAPNFTITKNGHHADVTGIAFMPYYLVFDHRGRLVAHHMGGSYHGGDGLTMIDVVDRLLQDVPAIYVGEEPYVHASDLARKVEGGKGLAATVKRLETQRAGEADPAAKAELDRLHGVVARYRDRRVRRALGLAGTRPGEVLSALKDLARDLKGTELGAEVDAHVATQAASADLAAAIAMEKKFRPLERAFLKLKEKQRTQAAVDRTVEKLEALIAGHEGLPFVATVEAFLANLR